MVVNSAMNKLDVLYKGLTLQIQNSVDVIKDRAKFKTEVSNDKSSYYNSEPSFNFNYVSYLNPTTIYNIHETTTEKIVSNDLKKDHENQQVSENEEKKDKVTEKSENEGISFWEEFQNNFSIDRKSIIKLYKAQNEKSKISLPLLFEGKNYTVLDTEYAVRAYSFAFNINKETDKTIEYIYKYNKSFDYRI